MSELEKEIMELTQVTQVRNKRVYFDVETKMHTLLRIENGESKSSIIKEMKLPPSTLATWIKDKDRISELYKHSVGHRKRLRQGSFPEVEERLIQWIKEVRASVDYELSGPIILAKAKKIAQNLGQNNFEGSTGWLERFKNRHGINSRGEPDMTSVSSTTSPSANRSKPVVATDQGIDLTCQNSYELGIGGPFVTPGCVRRIGSDEDDESILQSSDMQSSSALFDDELMQNSQNHNDGFTENANKILLNENNTTSANGDEVVNGGNYQTNGLPFLIRGDDNKKLDINIVKGVTSKITKNNIHALTNNGDGPLLLNHSDKINKQMLEEMFQRNIGQISAIITFTMAPLHSKLEDCISNIEKLSNKVDAIDNRLSKLETSIAQESDGKSILTTEKDIYTWCRDDNPDYYLWRLIRESYSTEDLQQFQWKIGDRCETDYSVTRWLQDEQQVKDFMDYIVSNSKTNFTSNLPCYINDRLNLLKTTNK